MYDETKERYMWMVDVFGIIAREGDICQVTILYLNERGRAWYKVKKEIYTDTIHLVKK